STTPPLAASPVSPPASAPSAKRQSAEPAGRASSNAAQAASSREGDSASVVHEEMPIVSHSALATVHGRVKVVVRVTVDQSGNVVGDRLENAGPSQYFARVASQAARKWKFAPAPGSASRTVLVRFEFSRGGATGHVMTRS